MKSQKRKREQVAKKERYQFDDLVLEEEEYIKHQLETSSDLHWMPYSVWSRKEWKVFPQRTSDEMENAWHELLTQCGDDKKKAQKMNQEWHVCRYLGVFAKKVKIEGSSSTAKRRTQIIILKCGCVSFSINWIPIPIVNGRKLLDSQSPYQHSCGNP